MSAPSEIKAVAPTATVAFQQKPSPPVQPAPAKKEDLSAIKVDMDAALKNLDAVEAFIKPFAGKLNYNPFYTIYERINPLRDLIRRGDKSPETFVKAMALKPGDESLAKPPTMPAPHGFIDHTKRGW